MLLLYPPSVKILGEVQVEMRGITGGDDEDLQDDASYRVKTALKRALAKEAKPGDYERACKSALLSILWERTKQRPMVVVNLLDV